ncbi:MAG: serine hydrolase domain-containing protein [Bacteroidota bacterium]
MRLPVFLFLFISVFSCVRQPPGNISNNILEQRIDSLFQDFDHLATPGYAIGVAKADQTLYAKGFGAANLDYNLPITEQSKFSIASVSKQFTAACIALLIMDGQLSLEAPASNFIPELDKYRDTIRIKHLVYNTSGIPDYYQLDRPGGKSWITFNYFDIDECIATALQANTLRFKPGDRWEYSNVNFMLLTKIIAAVSGQTFSAFAEERLFQPLGMEDSFINDDVTSIVENRVTPYNLRNEENINGYAEYGIQLKREGDFIQHHRNSPHYGGSGVITTIEDLLKWGKNMVSQEFGGQEFYEIMHATPSFNHDRNNQAFGLYHGDFNGRNIVAWDGGDWGISSQLMRFPDQGVTIVVLSNLGSGEAFRKVNAIGDILIAEKIIQ